MHDLEAFIVVVLLAFNLIPQRSHYSLTLPRSRIRDSATATLMPGDGTTAIKIVRELSSFCFPNFLDNLESLTFHSVNL